MQRSTQLAIDLLAKGLSQTDIAEMLDTSPSAISQVAATYAKQVDEKRSDTALGRAHTDSLADSLERKVLQKLDSAITMETNAAVLARVYQVVNGAKRRSIGEGQQKNVNNIAVLNLPTMVKRDVEFVQSQRGEIVQVDGKDLTSAPATQLHAMLAARDSEGGSLASPPEGAPDTLIDLQEDEPHVPDDFSELF